MFALLLTTILLQTPDSVYATPALRDLVARAAEGNREAPAELAGYGVLVESEIALVLRTTEAEELTSQVEQVASRLEWRRDGVYAQHVVGHRVQGAGPNVSVLTYLNRGWLVPSLYGEWLRLVTPQDSAAEQSEQGSTGKLADQGRGRDRDQGRGRDQERDRIFEAIHPLSEQRESVYRFTGGDTVAVIQLPERTLRIVRVRVTPQRPPGRSVLLFEGEIDLDADRHQVVRLRGRLVTFRTGRGLGGRVLSQLLHGIAYLDLENGEREGRYWLPHRQRLEFQAVTPLTESRAIVRVVSAFRDHGVDTLTTIAAQNTAAALIPDTLASDSSPPRRAPPRLTFAPSDSLAQFDGWILPPGAATSSLGADDFDDIAPPALRSHGPPRLGFGVRHLSELMRYNRVEGLYTGAGAVLSFRDLAPGLQLRGSGGWAWTEEVLRGTVELSLRRGAWDVVLQGGRELAHTNDFTPPFERHPGILLLLGGPDDFDYLDRRGLSIALGHDLDVTAEAEARLELGWYDDRPEYRRLDRARGGKDTLRLNRPITPGRYLVTRLVLERGRSINLHSLRPGIGATLLLERAAGELSWQRIETGVQLRTTHGPLTLAARVDVGLVTGSSPPLQVLYELGGGTSLPGYQYKEFAGDRAARLRGAIRYGLGVLDAPIRIRRLVLPGFAPAPAIRWQAAWTAAPGGVAAAVERLGSRPTAGIRNTVDLQLTLFGGMIGIGMARPLEHHSRWRLALNVGGGV